MVLYCGEEDELVVRAAAGAMAMLSNSEKICNKILGVRAPLISVCIRFEIKINKIIFPQIYWILDKLDKNLESVTSADGFLERERLLFCCMQCWYDSDFNLLHDSLQVGPWQEILLSVVVNENVEIQHRGCYIVRNMLSVNKEMAEKVIEGQMLEVLMALSILEDPQREMVVKCAASCLEVCVQHGLIKPKEWPGVTKTQCQILEVSVQ